MWGQAIDTAVGLTFLFAATALFCSALVEGLATVTERRSKYLITGLRNMSTRRRRARSVGSPSRQRSRSTRP